MQQRDRRLGLHELHPSIEWCAHALNKLSLSLLEARHTRKIEFGRAKHVMLWGMTQVHAPKTWRLWCWKVGWSTGTGSSCLTVLSWMHSRSTHIQGIGTLWRLRFCVTPPLWSSKDRSAQRAKGGRVDPDIQPCFWSRGHVHVCIWSFGTLVSLPPPANCPIGCKFFSSPSRVLLSLGSGPFQVSCRFFNVFAGVTRRESA